MNKENNKNAAGLRRSAMAERIRLREEWSELKGPCNESDKHKNVLVKKPQNVMTNNRNSSNTYSMRSKNVSESPINEILRGIVILVDVGSESRALALRAALVALGASVMPAWSPLVTHLVWSEGGCTKTRARARALACRLVSPIWVESCAASGRRLPERLFPAVSRPSDLPSPATLKKMLKRMDQENIPLNLLSESQEARDKRPRLRISSETDNTTDTTNDTSHDTSHDKSEDADIERNVNTAPRRALPMSLSPPRQKKSRRKLFTHKEAQTASSGNETDKETPPPKQKTVKHITRDGKRELVRAERLARRLLGTPKQKPDVKNNKAPRIVLTGMSKKERHDIWHAVQKLNGVVQSHVNKKTTHIIMGSCREPEIPSTINKQTGKQKTPPNCIVMCQKCNSPERILTQMFANNVTVTNKVKEINKNTICNCNISGVNVLSQNETLSGQGTEASHNITPNKRNKTNQGKRNDNQNDNIENTQYGQRIDNSQSLITPSKRNNQGNRIDYLNFNAQRIDNSQSIFTNVNTNNVQDGHIIGVNEEQRNDNSQNIITTDDRNFKPRTVNALLGAVRGCRVLYAQWVIDSVKANSWIHHLGYEVPHLLKISQKARIERLALNKMSSDYVYDVFNGMRVRVSENAEQKDAVKQLLTLCGAVIDNGENVQQNGGLEQQNGGLEQQNSGLTLQKRGKSQKKKQTSKSTRTQNGGTQATQNGGQPMFDITIGREIGEVSSKWVFDSIAAARMRTARRYLNNISI
ncbi:unnamed protein product, partial [Brenthis ino]